MLTKRNRMKSSWEFMSLDLIDYRLKQEVLELDAETKSNPVDYKKALYEFCDVAAFALFGILHCFKELRKKRK